MKQLYYNGVIYPSADATPASAVLIEDSSILAVGDSNELKKLAGETVQLHDLNGKFVLPGFQDSHCHLILTGMEGEVFDLTGVTSIEELINRGREFIFKKSVKDGEWIIGRGFNQNLFKNPILPDKNVADAISTSHPILLDRVCGHTGTLNSLAIQNLGFTKDITIPGGEFAKDETGELTGVIFETVLDYVRSCIPSPTPDKLYEIIKNACLHANSMGLTSVHSNDVTFKNMDEILEVFRRLEANNELTLRIYEEIQSSSMEDLIDFETRRLYTGCGSNYLKVGNIKLFTDGSLGAHSAYLQNDYTNAPGSCGIRIYDDTNLTKIISKADKMGMQVACHAIGDGAILQCIHAIETAQKENNTGNLRHRIVHCQIADDTLLDRMTAANITADIQPPFVITDWAVAEESLGDRVFNSYRWKTMLRKGIHLGGGSDSPVESLSPIWGIHCAVNRSNKDNIPKGGWHPDEKLTVSEAVSLYTKGTSYLSFEEDSKGVLAPGYLADFVVLSDDIFKISPEKIKDIKVIETIVGGKSVFHNP